MKSSEITRAKLSSLAQRVRAQSVAPFGTEGFVLLSEVADTLDLLAAQNSPQLPAGRRVSSGLRAQKTFDYVNSAVREEFRAVEKATLSRA